MSDKIKFNEIIDKDVVKGLEAVAEGLKKLDEELKGVAKSSKKVLEVTKDADFEGLKQLEKTFKTVNKAQSESEIIAKQRLKLEQRLKIARKDSIQQNEQLKVLNAEQNKINKEAAKEALGLVSAYQKQSKRLNDLRKEYKDLVLTQGKAAKGTKELLREIKELDKSLKDVDAEVGQFQRNVGNYPKVTETAKNGLSGLSGFLLGAFTSSLTKSRAASREFQGGLERAANVVRVFGIAIIKFTKGTAIPTIQNAFLSLKITALELQQSFTKVANFFTGGISGDKLSKEISDLQKQFNANKESIEANAGAFENLGGKIGETDKNIVARLKRQDELIDTTAKFNDEIQKLIAQEEVLEAQIGNSTVSFKDRDALIDELISTQESRLSLEQELANAELENALTSIENDLIRENLAKKFNKEQVISLQFLKDKAQADAIGLENLEKLTNATTRINELEKERRLQEQNAIKERLENARDLFEQELDFTLDIGDRQKSVNERQIANDKLTLEERNKILAKTTALLDDSFGEQLQITESFIKKSITLNSELTDAEKEGLTEKEQQILKINKAEEAVKKLNLEKLVNLEDEKKIRKELFEAGITDENVNNRIREIIIERKAAVQDLADAQNDLNDAQLESAQNIAASEQATQQDNLALQAELIEKELTGEEQKVQDIIDINERLFDVKKEAIEDQADFEAFQATQEIVEAEELAAKLKEIEEKKNNDIIRLEKDKNDAISDARKKTNEELSNLAFEATGEILKELAERSKAREAEIDEEISATQKRQDELRRLSESGVQNAEQSLADANVREAQLRKQKEEQIQRQKQIEASLAALEVFASEIQAGKSPTQALASTVTNVSLLRKVISSLPSFESGTDDTGSGRGRGVDGKGGFHAILHDNESVWTKEDNAKKGNRTNAQAANILEAYDKGTLQGVSIPNASNDDNLALMAGISELIKSNKSIEKSIGTVHKVHRDEFLNTFKLLVKKGNTTTVTKIDKYNL